MVCGQHNRARGTLCCWRRKKSDTDEHQGHALGRSRSSFSAKIHLLCERHGHPLHFHLTSGQTHESQALIDLLEGSDVVDHDDVPTAYPLRLAGDKGYRADWIDDYLLGQGILPVIPSKANQDHDARLVDFDKRIYRERNIVERLVGWLKESRRFFSRYEKTAKNFAGMLTMAFIHRYVRLMCD